MILHVLSFKPAKTTAEAKKMIDEIYGDYLTGNSACWEWFVKFKVNLTWRTKHTAAVGCPQEFRSADLQHFWMMTPIQAIDLKTGLKKTNYCSSLNHCQTFSEKDLKRSQMSAIWIVLLPAFHFYSGMRKNIFILSFSFINVAFII